VNTKNNQFCGGIEYDCSDPANTDRLIAFYSTVADPEAPKSQETYCADCIKHQCKGGPPPSLPASDAAQRKYDAKEAALAQQPQKESGMMPAWAFPLFGVVAMFSFAAFAAVRVRATRQIQVVQPVSQIDGSDEEALLSDGAGVE
jgi:hypothetical protein